MILNEYGEIAQKCSLEIPEHYSQVILDAFVFMPDHMHGITIINDFSAEGEKR
jgi:REP element-mobilizing transposase RayT